MRYAGIYPFDVSNGLGIRVVLFVQGCSFHCKGCFNKDTWDFKGNFDYTQEVENELLDLCNKEYISGLSIVGGEPLHDLNVKQVFKLCRRFKAIYPNKNIWLWSGFKMKDIMNSDNPYRKGILEFIDYLVDGRFKIDLKDKDLAFRGSSNQNIYEKYEGRWLLSDLNNI